MKLTLDSDDHRALQLIEEIARRMGLHVSRGKEQEATNRKEPEQKKQEFQKQLKGAPKDERKYPVPDNERAIVALEKLASYGAFKNIEDPVEWQREIRKDKPLTGRDD